MKINSEFIIAVIIETFKILLESIKYIISALVWMFSIMLILSALINWKSFF